MRTLVLCVVLGAFSAVPAESATPTALVLISTATPSAAESGWKANETDNIAGLSDLKKLSNPAVVDYAALLAATPEYKEMEKGRIDPESPKGRTLRQQASDRVTKAADLIRRDKRYCSVWKEISHKDGRKVPDVTQEVKDKLERV
jgi:hypothetical protein